jgi:hypothetical protein
MIVPQGEWERDRQGLPAMTGPVFFDAAFEMVDQWSPSVKASDIVVHAPSVQPRENVACPSLT